MPLLKQARERSGLSASDLARLTRLSPRTISAIDEERFDELPAGLYARASLRAYAIAIGLDPVTVLEGAQGRLPDAPLDLVVLAELRAPKRQPSYFRYTFAATIDAALLVAIGFAILVVCSAFCALAPFGLLRAAPLSMTILCAMPTSLYFWLLGATGVRTLGPWLLDLEILPRADGPLSLRTWLRRGLLYFRREVTFALRPVLIPSTPL